MTEVIHKASSAGRRSKRYRETRSLMGDDYTTTVTAAEDVMQDIFAKVWR
jgi:DNA-directed RNA polymerase specialized sigma24 family protein